MKVKSLTWVQLFATPWTVAHEAPPSMEFRRQEYWSGLPFPSSGDLPNPRIKPKSRTLQTDASPSELSGKPPLSYEHTSNQICMFTTVLKLYFSELQMVTSILPTDCSFPYALNPVPLCKESGFNKHF